MIVGIIASQLTAPSVWTNIGSGTQNGSQNYYHSSGCPSEATVRTWLTTNYPPANYASGYIMRVRAYDDGFALCQDYYYRAD
jgi:hypothetical protein